MRPPDGPRASKIRECNLQQRSDEVTVFVTASAARTTSIQLSKLGWPVWRRERDSNPRYPFGYSGFQDMTACSSASCIQWLTTLSVARICAQPLSFGSYCAPIRAPLRSKELPERPDPKGRSRKSCRPITQATATQLKQCDEINEFNEKS